jgi:hypothetical protein
LKQDSSKGLGAGQQVGTGELEPGQQAKGQQVGTTLWDRVRTTSKGQQVGTTTSKGQQVGTTSRTTTSKETTSRTTETTEVGTTEARTTTGTTTRDNN